VQYAALSVQPAVSRAELLEYRTSRIPPAGLLLVGAKSSGLASGPSVGVFHGVLPPPALEPERCALADATRGVRAGPARAAAGRRRRTTNDLRGGDRL
jgi:hypothetical protein